MSRESNPDRVARHYAHAALRLRHRYGLHMSLEEYRNLSGQAKASKHAHRDDPLENNAKAVVAEAFDALEPNRCG